MKFENSGTFEHYMKVRTMKRVDELLKKKINEEKGSNVKFENSGMNIVKMESMEGDFNSQTSMSIPTEKSIVELLGTPNMRLTNEECQRLKEYHQEQADIYTELVNEIGIRDTLIGKCLFLPTANKKQDWPFVNLSELRYFRKLNNGINIHIKFELKQNNDSISWKTDTTEELDILYDRLVELIIIKDTKETL